MQTELGPDATGVGWVFQYALVDESGKHSLADLRSLQDWSIRYDLQAVPGVAEVASLGGFVRQYQVTVDPNKLASYGIPLMTVDRGDPLIEQRGRRAPRGVERRRVHGPRRMATSGPSPTSEEIVVKTDEKGTPVRLRDVGRFSSGPRCGAASRSSTARGKSPRASSSCASGENAMDVITRVKAAAEGDRAVASARREDRDDATTGRS